MGPAATGAEQLVDLLLRREHRRRQAAHEHPGFRRHRDRDTMSLRTTSRSGQPAAFQWRLGLLFAMMSVAALSLAGVAVPLPRVEHEFLPQRGAPRAVRGGGTSP